MEVGEREIIYPSLQCHHQNYFCIKMGSDESHFNVSIGSDGQSHKTVSTNHNLFEEKGEPKWYRTKVHPLTSLTHRLTRETYCSQASLYSSLQDRGGEAEQGLQLTCPLCHPYGGPSIQPQVHHRR